MWSPVQSVFDLFLKFSIGMVTLLELESWIFLVQWSKSLIFFGKWKMQAMKEEALEKTNNSVCWGIFSLSEKFSRKYIFLRARSNWGQDGGCLISRPFYVAIAQSTIIHLPLNQQGAIIARKVASIWTFFSMRPLSMPIAPLLSSLVHHRFIKACEKCVNSRQNSQNWPKTDQNRPIMRLLCAKKYTGLKKYTAGCDGCN